MQSNAEHLWSGQNPASWRIHTLFELSAKRYPHNTALVFQNESLSFKELNEKADILCHAILNWAYYDDVIGISTTPGPEMVIGVLAILKSGKAFLPIDLKASRQKNQQIIADANLNFCLSKSAEYLRFSDLDLKVIESDTDRKYPTIHEKRLGNLAYIMFTSGSSCNSKGVKIEHKVLVNYLLNAVTLYTTEQSHTAGSYLQLPISFDAAMTSLFAPLLCGKTLVLANSTNASAFNDPNFEKYMPYDFIKLTPLQFNWLEKAIDTRPLALAKQIVVGGENLHKRHFQFMIDKKFHTDIINEYGPTEATVGCMTYRLALNENIEDNHFGIPIGKAMPGNEVLILNDKMEAVGPGEIGEIYIGGAQLSAGYLMRSELNATCFIQHPFEKSKKVFKTGDYATINAEGTAIYLDRAENHQETEGRDFNVIEWNLSRLPGIKQCEVVCKTINNKQRLLAYILADNTGLDIESIPVLLSQTLDSNEMPEKFILINEWPYTLHGKLNKHALPIPHCTEHRKDSKRLPETEIQKDLANMWCQLLNIQNPDIDTGFFEMGGNYLLAEQMVQSLRLKHAMEINIAMLYKCSSIACLATEIEKQAQFNSTAKKIFRLTERGYSV